ncbi:MAG: ABC transporter ATP-binding protein [Oscillospiraceae bacterium]|nr:ABC transporter ATP-binding protein [Oscillospiraceae bacterium]
MSTIEFQDFSCFYKYKKEYITALDHINLSVESGELLVILGQSGSGKTTLLKCILGLCDYISGQLYIDGTSIDDFRLQNSNIGYIRQELNLYPHLTIYENIAFPLRMIHTPQAEVDRRVKELAALLEIDWLLTRKPKQLSGGQLQRVAIARALIKNPVTVLFDEPFSAIDPTLRTELRQLVKKIHQTFGCTILFVTHDLTDALNLAQRVVILEEGKIEAVGTPRELMQKGYLL